MAETAPEAIDISEKALADQVIAEEQARHLQELLQEDLLAEPRPQPLATAPPRRSWAEAIRLAEQPHQEPGEPNELGSGTTATTASPARADRPGREHPRASMGQVRLVRAGGLLVLPPPESGSSDIARTGVELTSFRDFLTKHVLGGAVEIEGRPRKHHCDAVVCLNFQVVPTPDTTDDPTMVSIASPPDGRTALARHVGHLYTRDVTELDGFLHQVAERANAPIGCQGWVELHRVSGEGRERIVPTVSSPLTSAEEREFGYSIGDIRVVLPKRSTLGA